jgi:hypothetical protein
MLGCRRLYSNNHVDLDQAVGDMISYHTRLGVLSMIGMAVIFLLQFWELLIAVSAEHSGRTLSSHI